MEEVRRMVERRRRRTGRRSVGVAGRRGMGEREEEDGEGQQEAGNFTSKYQAVKQIFLHRQIHIFFDFLLLRVYILSVLIPFSDHFAI